MKRFLFVLLCICVTFSSTTFAYALNQIIADDAVSLVDDKIYCTATIDDDFDDDTILVVLDKVLAN